MSDNAVTQIMAEMTTAMTKLQTAYWEAKDPATKEELAGAYSAGLRVIDSTLEELDELVAQYVGGDEDDE